MLPLSFPHERDVSAAVRLSMFHVEQSPEPKVR
jgi:hypothetical protein